MRRRVKELAIRWVLLAVTSIASLSVLAIIFFIAKDALPFFGGNSIKEFFFSTSWYPSHDPPEFGAAAIFAGSAIVTTAPTTT